MSLILLVSITIRLVALVWSIVLLRRIRDWRMAFLAIMLGLMALRQTLTLWKTYESWTIVITGQATEFPGLIVSIMAFLAIFFLERMLSERKQAEKALKTEVQNQTKDLHEAKEAAEAANRDVSQLMDSSPDFIFKSRIDNFKFTEVNQTACEFYGYAREDFLEMGIFDIEVDPPLEEQVRNLYDTTPVGKVLEVDGINKKKNGETFPVHVKFVKLDNEFALANVRDITERRLAEETLRKSEERCRIVLETMSEGVGFLDINSSFSYVNDQLCEILGLSRDELIGMHVISKYLDEANKRIYEEQIAKRQEGIEEPYEVEISRKDGQKRSLSLSPKVLRDEQGNFIGSFATVRDVTERKRAEEQIRQQQLAQLAHVSRLSTMGQLVAEITHEICQPLYIIINFVNACKSVMDQRAYEQDEKLRQWISDIGQEALRCDQIIKHLQKFVSPSEFQRSAVDLNDIVHISAQLEAPEARKYQTKVHLDLDENLPKAFADDILIQQVIVNLLRNAFEALSFTKDSDRLVTVRTFTGLGGIEVAVRDNGMGIKPGEENELFGAFYSTKENGMGMGLSICKTIIQQHGGTIWAESNSGRGTTFRFTLPMNRESKTPER